MYRSHLVLLKSSKSTFKLSSFHRSFIAAKKYCVIGAGTAGLCSAKHILAAGGNVTVYEQSNKIGGTWVYSDKIGYDKYGLDICTSMYHGLVTNLPKEIMGFPDYAIKHENSYIDSKTVLQFLKNFVKDFNLDNFIKFEHYVLKIQPLDKQWQVTVKNLPENQEIVEYYDFIFVCNGNYSTPNYPNYPGRNTFKGRQIHSHNYRVPEPYKDESVLIIGAGPSAKDIGLQIAQVAKKIIVSHHSEKSLDYCLPKNVIQKPDVANLLENHVEFIDGSKEYFSVILYCTGYLYNFPFLPPECGIKVEENCVYPLYKHIINVNNPTMAFIGIPFPLSQMMDLQIRFALKFFLDEKNLPSQEEMMKDVDEDLNLKWKMGFKKKQAHDLGSDQGLYFDDLAKTAEIEPLKPFIVGLFQQSQSRVKTDYWNYRKDNYKIVDDDFIKIN